MLKQYLLNSKRIYFHSLKSGNPLTKFKLGQKVSGIVEVFSPVEGCLLELDYGVSGVVHPTHCTRKHDFFKLGFLLPEVGYNTGQIVIYDIIQLYNFSCSLHAR